MSLAIIGAVKALGLNILELRAVDAPVEKLAVCEVSQAPSLAPIRTGIFLGNRFVPSETLEIDALFKFNPFVAKLICHLNARRYLPARPFIRRNIVEHVTVAELDVILQLVVANDFDLAKILAVGVLLRKRGRVDLEHALERNIVLPLDATVATTR